MGCVTTSAEITITLLPPEKGFYPGVLRLGVLYTTGILYGVGYGMGYAER